MLKLCSVWLSHLPPSCYVIILHLFLGFRLFFIDSQTAQVMKRRMKMRTMNLILVTVLGLKEQSSDILLSTVVLTAQALYRFYRDVNDCTKTHFHPNIDLRHTRNHCTSIENR
jgi:hypothetical protein